MKRRKITIKINKKIVEEIPHKKWIKSFNKYNERLEKCVGVEGAYFEHLVN